MIIDSMGCRSFSQKLGFRDDLWYVRDDRPFAGLRRRQRSITPRVTARRASQKSWPFAASCSATVTVVEPLFDPQQKERPITPAFATPMRGEGSSNWPTSRKRPETARKPNRSRRSRWRRSGVSTRCSRSSVPSTAAAPTSGGLCARTRANRFSTTCTPGCSTNAKPSHAPPRC